ncbi:alpha/beta hydrolase [Halothiobacillus sp. DCM-1]|uniref:alpha/beta hydrolase n=1 Tax=Halothiobacillus sp. DCM-1 TaxID=3112558 RepID=UPI00324CC0DA
MSPQNPPRKPDHRAAGRLRAGRFRHFHRGWMLVLALLGLSGCSGITVLNTLAPSQNIRTHDDLQFDHGHHLSLDIYQPEHAQDAPVVVFFWGGSWQEGDKSLYAFVGRALAARGFVVAIPNYRLYPAVRYPEFLFDSAHAVAWVRAHIDRYGGNPQHLILMGHSAGAYNAAMLALDPQYLHAVGLARHDLAGVIGLGGPYDFLPLVDPALKAIFSPAEPDLAQTQPIHWVDGQSPPMLLIESTADTIVAPKNTRHLAAALRTHGAPVSVRMVPDLSHQWLIGVVSNLLSFRDQGINAAIDRFIRDPQVATRF